MEREQFIFSLDHIYWDHVLLKIDVSDQDCYYFDIHNYRDFKDHGKIGDGIFWAAYNNLTLCTGAFTDNDVEIVKKELSDIWDKANKDKEYFQ
jgi:hypothetical protein